MTPILNVKLSSIYYLDHQAEVKIIALKIIFLNIIAFNIIEYIIKVVRVLKILSKQNAQIFLTEFLKSSTTKRFQRNTQLLMSNL